MSNRVSFIVLDKLWAKWLVDVNKDEPDILAWLPEYPTSGNPDTRTTNFDAWLNSNGARVMRSSTDCYVKIINENLFMMLVLKYV